MTAENEPSVRVPKHARDLLAKTFPNPYRAGSKKAAAYELFYETADRPAAIEAMLKLGVTAATAATWLSLFLSRSRKEKEQQEHADTTEK
jgi:hypothetical protein